MDQLSHLSQPAATVARTTQRQPTTFQWWRLMQGHFASSGLLSEADLQTGWLPALFVAQLVLESETFLTQEECASEMLIRNCISTSCIPLLFLIIGRFECRVKTRQHLRPASFLPDHPLPTAVKAPTSVNRYPTVWRHGVWQHRKARSKAQDNHCANRQSILPGTSLFSEESTCASPWFAQPWEPKPQYNRLFYFSRPSSKNSLQSPKRVSIERVTRSSASWRSWGSWETKIQILILWGSRLVGACTLQWSLTKQMGYAMMARWQGWWFWQPVSKSSLSMLDPWGTSSFLTPPAKRYSVL
jgi:hypothetical protein